jgi:hypothetical protein
MSGIASSFWTSDDRLREGQQSGADLEFGVLRRSQIDFGADLVALQKEANPSPSSTEGQTPYTVSTGLS